MYIKPTENLLPKTDIKKTPRKREGDRSFDEFLIQTIEDTGIVDSVNLSKDKEPPEGEQKKEEQDEEEVNKSSAEHAIDIEV